MGKVKIHELAKELNKTSKEVLEKAQELQIEAKSHLSSIDEKEAEKIKNVFSTATSPKKEKGNKQDKEAKHEKEKTTGPVIIRRNVIISDEELAKKEEEEKRKRQSQKKENIGFVERDRKKDYNIVYREKPTKPLTVSELFGINKKQEPEKKELVQEKPVNTEVSKSSETNQIQQSPANEKNNYNKNYSSQNTDNRNRNYNYQNRSNFDNRNKNYNNQTGDNRNSNNYNRGNQTGDYKNRNNYQRQGFKNNTQRNNNQGFNKRPLDEKGIEKNIKNIMSTEVTEKEVTREYNKFLDKEKVNNRYDDNKTKKSKSRRVEEFDEDKLKSLKQENRLSNMFDDQEGGMLDYYDLTTIRGKRNKKKANKPEEQRIKQKIFKLTQISIPETITVKDLATELKKTSGEIIKKLLGYGVLATINNEIDFDTAFLIASEFGVTAMKKEKVTEEDILFDETEDVLEELQDRPPVIVVMGHVDHGKTSLLDAVRSTNVIEGEAGGITQHIGAYKVEVNGREITFLDTPGHEAFTSMRARGAQITDIAILVVAANDGVMPQTVEAINHAKAAGIPIIVAINKIDLEGSNIEKIKEELTKYELVPEEWGGDTIFVPISAKKGTNIDSLLEMVLLVADMKQLKANPKKQAKGVVIEARLDKSRGPIATMLVQRGTLDTGDTIVVGSAIGRIRLMINDKGQKVKKAGPSTPVEITGLAEVPEAGDVFYEVKDEKTAKHLIERRKRQARDKSINITSKVSLDDLFNQIEKGNLKQLNLIVKADVQGSVEAVKQALEKINNEEVQVKVIHSNVGAVTESDVTLAKVSNAIIIAFNVRLGPIAKDIAKKEQVEIKQYSIIYQAIEDIETAIKGMLTPKYEEVVIGTLEIRQTFKVSNIGTIAGCYVTNGKITRNSSVRVIRDNIVIHDGKLSSLKRFKDDAKEVSYGYECGIQIENFNDIKESDIIEAYIMQEIKR